MMSLISKKLRMKYEVIDDKLIRCKTGRCGSNITQSNDRNRQLYLLRFAIKQLELSRYHVSQVFETKFHVEIMIYY